MFTQIFPLDNLFILAAHHYDLNDCVIERFATKHEAELAEKAHRYWHWIQPEWFCPNWLPRHYPYRGDALLRKSLYDSYEGVIRPFSNPTHRMALFLAQTQVGVDEAYQEYADSPYF